MLGVPAHTRKALLSRGEDYSPELERCQRPIALLHGLRDSVVLPAMSRHIASRCSAENLGFDLECAIVSDVQVELTG